MASRGRGARAKGFQFERDVAAVFSAATGSDFKRGLGQTRGGGDEVADVVTDHQLGNSIHIECKRQKQCSIKAAMRQAEADAGANAMPVVVTKDDRKPALVTMKMEDFMVVFATWWKANEQRNQGNISVATAQDLPTRQSEA